MSFLQPTSTANPQPRIKESSALQKVMWFGILQLVSFASGWVSWFYVASAAIPRIIAQNLTSTSTPSEVSAALAPLFGAMTLVVPLIAAINIVSLVVLTIGFRELREVDRPAFSLPSTLMILMVVGGIITVVGVVPFLNGISSIIAQAPTSTSAAPSAAFFSAIAPFFFALALFAIGGLLAFIGLIAGLILGLWRVGSRYDQTIIKLGAIFAIIPVLDIAAPVLVIVGAQQARQKVSSGG